MEMTRHFASTMYIANDGAIALHWHERLGARIPPGGHVDRDESPHEADLYKVREGARLGPELVDNTPSVPTPAGRALPQPRQQMFYDISIHGDSSAGHQHIDHVFYTRVNARNIDPTLDEADPEIQVRYDESDLRGNDIDPDTMQFALGAIEAVRADKRER